VTRWWKDKLPSPALPSTAAPAMDSDPVCDFLGQALDQAHALGLRFIARLDLSKCHKHVYESRPEWFFRRADGQPQVYNGLYSTCVNGGYYQDYAFEIMQEILAGAAPGGSLHVPDSGQARPV
jgi:putative glycosyl hydrolase-like family 6 (GHL6) protein